jgi:hypothetical protein
MNDKREALPYALEDRVFPSPSDDDLWRSVLAAMRREYPDRVLLEHVRQAFERVCDENDDAMLFKDFLRKVRLAWLWKRPPAPRGMLDLE